MDYTEQFIRLNCSLMSDYKMMKLNAEMKCMGIGLYIQMILFLRRQQEYKHDFNELDLLAEQWGATVEDLQHLIKDFNLFVIIANSTGKCNRYYCMLSISSLRTCWTATVSKSQ